MQRAILAFLISIFSFQVIKAGGQGYALQNVAPLARLPLVAEKMGVFQSLVLLRVKDSCPHRPLKGEAQAFLELQKRAELYLTNSQSFEEKEKHLLAFSEKWQNKPSGMKSLEILIAERIKEALLAFNSNRKLNGIEFLSRAAFIQNQEPAFIFGTYQLSANCQSPKFIQISLIAKGQSPVFSVYAAREPEANRLYEELALGFFENLQFCSLPQRRLVGGKALWAWHPFMCLPTVVSSPLAAEEACLKKGGRLPYFWELEALGQEDGQSLRPVSVDKWAWALSNGRVYYAKATPPVTYPSQLPLGEKILFYCIKEILQR